MIREIGRYAVVVSCAGVGFILSSYLIRYILLTVDPDLKITRKLSKQDVGAWIGL